jgi:bacterioferritin
MDQAVALRKPKNPPPSEAATFAVAGWAKGIVKLLDDALATELVAMLRYRRHHYTARGLASVPIAEQFLVHSQDAAGHADRLASRIVQLGGQPDFAPDTLHRRSQSSYDASSGLKAMVESNLLAEHRAIDSGKQFIQLIGTKDPSTRRLLEDILAVAQQHAQALQGWMGA